MTTTSQDKASTDDGMPSPEEIAEYRKEIDWIDAEILRLIQRRVEISKTVGKARMAAGGTRLVHNREMAIFARYRDLGEEGRAIANALLNLGRGKLGRAGTS